MREIFCYLCILLLSKLISLFLKLFFAIFYILCIFQSFALTIFSLSSHPQLNIFSVLFISSLSNSSFFFPFNRSTTSTYVLQALPALSADYEAQAEKLTVPFTGDPAFFAFASLSGDGSGGEAEVEIEAEDPDAPPVERFREVNRLSFNVKVHSNQSTINFKRIW